MPAIRISLADQLDAFAAGVPAQVKREIEAERESILTEIAEDLEDRFVHEVFGQQRAPDGSPWTPISPLTTEVRKGTGMRASNKLGIGPRNAMIKSFQIGDSNNHMRIRKWKLEFGSKLQKSGHFVVETFQKTYTMPRGNSEEKRSRIRRFMLATTGIPAPGKGRNLKHPGRQVVGFPKKWQDGHMSILKAGINRALLRAMRQASSVAAGRVAGTAAGAAPRRISEVG